MNLSQKLRGLLILILLMNMSGAAWAQDPAIPITPQPDGRLCWSYADAQLPVDESFDDFIGNVGRGDGIYTYYELRSSDSGQLDLLGFEVYTTDENEAVLLHLEIYSPEIEDQHVRYLLLINEQQVPIKLGDEEYPYLDVRLIPSEKATYDIPLPKLDKGVQDILLVDLKGIDSAPELTGRTDESNHRMTLIVGEIEDPVIELQRLEPMAMIPSVPQLLSLTFGDSLAHWSYPDPQYRLNNTQPLEFNILTGYAGQTDLGNNLPDPAVSQFALLLFVNYKQIPITSTHNVIYGEVDKTTAYVRIPVTISSFEQQGEHEILVVRINNPRIPMCILRGPDDGYWFAFDAIHKRAAFEVVGF